MPVENSENSQLNELMDSIQPVITKCPVTDDNEIREALPNLMAHLIQIARLEASWQPPRKS